MSEQQSNGSEARIHELERQLSDLRDKEHFLEREIKACREEKEKFQLMADFAQDWILWIDSKGSFVWISPSSIDLTGFTPDEFFRNPSLFYQLILQEDEQLVRRFMHDSIGFMQMGQSVEFRILTKTKQLRWCELNSRAVFDKMGSYLGQRCSVRDITRLKNALGHIREIADNQVWEKKANQRYREEIAGKEREMVSSLIRIAQKNEIIAYLKKNLTTLKASLPVPMQQKVAAMVTRVDEHQRSQLFSWEDFKFYFERIHQGFFTRLKGKFPALTAKDLRLCAYIHLGLSTKEMAGLTNVTPESVEIGRVRLRKKLGLTRSQNLNLFLQQI